MNKVLIAAAAFAGSVVSVGAADLPMRAPALIAAPAFSWTACHVGANVGGIWDESRADLRTGPGAYFAPAGGAAPPNAAGGGLLAGDYRRSHYSNFRESGVTGGVGFGCDWQTLGPIVVGTQSDFNLNGRARGAFPASPSENVAFTVAGRTETVTNDLNWFFSSRIRVGVAIDRLLIYATGGLGYFNTESRTAVTFDPGGAATVYPGASHVGSSSKTRFGGVIGGGLEYAFWDNWSVKAEYLYASFESSRYRSPLIAPAGVAPGYAWDTTVSPSVQMVRVGVNYRFRWF